MPIRGWELSRLVQVEEAGAGEGEAGGGGASPAPSPSTPAEPSSSYSAVDPGYVANDSDSSDDVLADLKAENTPNKADANEAPSEPAEKLADAGGVAEESVESNEDFSDALLSRAVALGYTVADIKSFRSEKSLDKEISRVERIQQRMGGQAPASAELPVDPAAEPAVDTSEPDWVQMVADGYDEKFVELQQRTWQRAQAAEAGMRQFQQEHQRREFDAQVQRFDTTLANLGAEYESLFGAGAMADVKQASPEMAQKRVEVFHKFQQLKNSYLMNRLPLPPEKELIEEAVHARFWKQTKTLARKELTNDIKKAGSQAMSRPRSTGRQALAGAPAALAKEQDFWKKFS